MKPCRRRLLGALLAVLLPAPAACGGRDEDQPATGTSRNVAFSVAATKLTVSQAMGEGFRAGVARVGGVAAEVKGPETIDGPKQLEIFQSLTKTARGGISIFTLTPELFAKPMAEAAGGGIPIIAVDNPPMVSTGVKLFVGNDNHELGRMLAREIIAKLPAAATGTVVIGTTVPGAKVLDRRARGMRDEFKEKMPGVTVRGPFDTREDAAGNLAAWKVLTTANKGALAFLGTGEADGVNLAQIRHDTKAKWLAGAFDLHPASLLGVKSGDLVLVSPEHFLKGEVAGWLQAQHAKTGEPLPEGWLYTPGLAVNSSNIDAVVARQSSTDAIAKAVATQVDTILGDKSYLREMSAIS
jgi:ribose transport system substrate-binding protein